MKRLLSPWEPVVIQSESIIAHARSIRAKIGFFLTKRKKRAGNITLTCHGRLIALIILTQGQICSSKGRGSDREENSESKSA